MKVTSETAVHIYLAEESRVQNSSSKNINLLTNLRIPEISANRKDMLVQARTVIELTWSYSDPL